MTGSRPYVVYIFDSPVTHWDTERFGFTEMDDQDIGVVALEVADLVAPTVNHSRAHYYQFSNFDLNIVHDLGGLEQEHQTLENANAIICSLGAGRPYPETIRILRAIGKSGTPYVLLMTNYQPGPDLRETTTTILDRLINKLRRMNIRNSIFTRLPLPLLGINPADFVVYGGRRSRLQRPLIGKHTIPIAAHSMDYDLYLETRSMPGARKDIAVFIDQGLGFHRDAERHGFRQAVTPEKYYPRLRMLFDRIEEEMGLEVVIASSRRIDYSDKPGLFGRRRIECGQTIELVRDCGLVIGVYSTALGFAVMFEKPVLIHTTIELSQHLHLYGCIENTANSLGATMVWLEDVETADIGGAIAFDRDRLDAYRLDYLKDKDSPDIPYWQIVINTLRQHRVLPAREVVDDNPREVAGATD